jgi:2OG-Fe(II) oxygenase superfamily
MECSDKRNHGHDDEEEENSVTSQEALMELLGLQSLTLALDEDTDNTTTTTTAGQYPYRICVPPNNHRHFHAPDKCWAYQFPQLLSADECQHIIDLASSSSSSPAFQYVTQALHITPDGQQMAVQLQNPNRHKLSVFSHPPTVEMLWNKLQTVLSLKDKFANDTSENSDSNTLTSLLTPFLDREGVDSPTGLNPRLRVLRYDSTDQDEFIPHFDATTRMNDERQGISLLTVLLYLNTGGGSEFEGGETCFWNAAEEIMSSTKKPATTKTTTPTSIIPKAGTVVVFEHDLYHSGQPLQWGTKYVLRTDLVFDMSQEQWELRASKGSVGGGGARQPHADPHASASTTTPSDSLSGNNISTSIPSAPTAPTTVGELMESIDNWNVADRRLVFETLDDIGLMDSSIESFCAPGHSVMQSMLQDMLPVTATSASRRAMNVVVDRAFVCLQQSRAL